ncbi:MAG: hypothetical protein JNJ78_18975 [Anaerolineae bacterium]|nr:hypothetical protein [Anaerolineae bacterium]
MSNLTDTSTRRPIIDPLLLALKSRRVLVALCALVVGLLTLAVPEVQPVRGEILTLLITLTLAVIGGYSLEDAARAGRERAAQSTDDLRQLVKDMLNDLIDETAANIPTTPPDQP